ncbi:MAG TPA: lysine transporter LysE [Flavobacteriaceae bacterium]|nr:lysine transporter LysE [Flavobacteriaceae bacterium]
MDIGILLSFIGATSLLAISPGPDNIFVLIQSVTNGVKYGLATVFGLISGCLVHTSLVAFGVSALIKENEHVFLGLKFFGAAYLIYLAYKIYRSPLELSLTSDKKLKKNTIQLFKQGFIMNVLNPKVSIFFLAFFPAFLFSESLSKLAQFFILGFVFMIVSLIVFSLIAFLAGTISNSILRYTKVGHYLKWMQIVVFVGIVVFILFT